MAAKKATAAQRANARRVAAVSLPPIPPKVKRDLSGLHLRVAGRVYLLGPSLTGDPISEMTTDGAATVALSVHDPDGTLLQILGTEEMLLNDGARIVLDDVVYVLATVEPGDESVRSLVFEDEVTWRLRQFTRYMAISRNRSTAAEFILRMVDEASARPLARMPAFIPELLTKQPIADPDVAA